MTTINMKRVIIAAVLALGVMSCSSSLHNVKHTAVNQTRVDLNQANFEHLGFYRGTYSENIVMGGKKVREGITAKAKEAMIANAKAAGS